MTIWDNIYKNFQQGGQAWATLSEDIIPLFKDFLDQNTFETKYAFDIGCGTGKYLKLLQAGGFKTDGIDSSETAVQMTQKELTSDSIITCAEMFNFIIPKNKYDLILSIAAIHHGKKDQVNALIHQIHEALIENGKIFITLPDIGNTKKWITFDKHEEIAPGTFVPLAGPEQGLPHSFYSKEEIESLFSEFHNVQLDLDERGRWFIRAFK